MAPDHISRNTLELGKEYPQPNEHEIAEYTLQLLKDEMKKLYPDKTKQLRQIHPKMNGCVKAEFIIDPDLPENLKVGLFKEAKSFPAWIRFSNGKTKPLPDWKKDIRGFAIKIMNVPGEKLEGAKNQDFILMNTKGFVASDVKQFSKILFVVTTPFNFSTLFKKVIIFFGSLPVLKRAAKAAVKMKNPAEIPYFSTVPFRFGDETRAVKYAVFPSPDNKLVTDAKRSADMIKENFAATLRQNEIYYDFKIQFQEDPVKMPMENPSVVWESEFIKVATIRIPKQEFDTAEQNAFGDNLSLNSWHSLPEHKPLGNFNRVRKIIYEGMYSFRHKHNGLIDIDP